MRKSPALLAAAALLLAGCQSVGVDPGQTAVLVDDYAMVATPPEVFDCQEPETQEYYWNVRKFQYPSRQISYDATLDANAERPPYVVVSNAKAPAEMNVPVSVTFDLTANCEDLKQFHRDFGTKYLPNNEDEIIVDRNDGWKNLLNYVIGKPLEQTLISVSQKYQWREIWNDEAVRVEYRDALQKALPAESQARTNGKQYFTNFRVTVGKPDPVDDGLKAAIVAEQGAIANARATEARGVADANARKAKADADVQAAIAETKVAEQEALTEMAKTRGFPTVEDYLRNECIHTTGCTMYGPSPIIAGAR